MLLSCTYLDLVKATDQGYRKVEQLPLSALGLDSI